MNIKRLKQLLMKKLDLSSHCHGCGVAIEPFDKESRQEIFTRRYVGGKGHLVVMSFHRECLVEDLYIDFVLKRPV